MKKQGIKLTSKVLTGLVLLTGITSLPTNAVEVKTAAVDVNKASVKAKVYELNGHYYAKLVADKEVANVIARITTETKSEFVLKKDLIKAGEEVVVELDMTAKAPTRKLPNTEVKREGYTAVNKVGTHTFNINVRYEIATDEVKAKQKETPKPVNEPKKEDTPETSATNDQSKGNEAATKSEQPAATTPAENTKSAEAPKKAETTVARPNTSDNEKPADKPADLVKQSTKPVAGTDRSAVATPAKEDTKAVERKAQAVKEEKAATKTETEKPKQQTPAAPAAGSREEQIRKAFLDKVAKLRNINGLPALSENAALNSSSKFRSSDVPTRAVDANIHGPNGTIQYEKDAAKAAGYANYILANISITGDTGTPEEVAQRLFDILFKEIGNVVAKYPYGHRNTLLDATAKDVGAGVTIKNGQVYLVQHQSSNEAFNGTTPKAGKYLDGSNTIFKGGKPV
ncbi:CAP domain-containing protein [Gemella haemolysans]|uniref:CAP domain-containing protein n=1 Tax=Gemella haemolysans TaxID=1379 RepID=A0AAW6B6T6_9BACL|nr:CAP domain-containing protein [Gemella haemolysans]MDB6186829.1 CAP domain-containing protein [Gemella haemolysans]